MSPALPERKRIGIYLTAEAHDTLKRYCRLKDVSVTAWLEGMAVAIADREARGELNVEDEIEAERASLEYARQITQERLRRAPRVEE